MQNRHDSIEPHGWKRPRGYSNGMLAAPGRLLFVSGQIGWDEEQRLVSERFVEQFDRALANVLAVVNAAGGRSEDLCRLTIYVSDKSAYIAELKAVGEVYRKHMAHHFPAMSLVEVAALLEPGAMVEIEGTAIIPAQRY
jgi:enamine deaminase RidA (YjgF/YER057c/UK114 family)